MYGSTGKPVALQPSRPPLRNLIRKNPTARARCKTMRLVLSLGQVQYTTRSRSFGSNEGFARTSTGASHRAPGMITESPSRSRGWRTSTTSTSWLAAINACRASCVMLNCSSSRPSFLRLARMMASRTAAQRIVIARYNSALPRTIGFIPERMDSSENKFSYLESGLRLASSTFENGKSSLT